MPHYYTVKWVDNKGVEHTTSTTDPNRLQSKVNSSYGGSARVTQVDYGDARAKQGSIYKEESTKPVMISGQVNTRASGKPVSVTTTNLSTGEKTTTPYFGELQFGSPVRIVAQKGKPETGIEPFTTTPKEIYEVISNRQKQYIDYINQEQNKINPNELYYIKGEIGQISGTELIKRYESIKQQNLTDTNITISELKSYPSGTKFIPSSEGYNIEYPQSYIDRQQLSWAKHYRQEAQNLPPGLSELSRVGVGLELDLYSVVKPVANFFGFGKEFDTMATVGMSRALNPIDSKAFLTDVYGGLEHTKFGVHYPSPLDYAFEPIGLAPKGSSEFLSSDPWITAGGIGGEIGQVAAFVGVTSGITKGVQAGSKFVFKTTPRVTARFSKLFPEAVNIFEKVPGSKYVSGALTKSGISENLEKWAVYGYRPAKTLAEVTVGPPIKSRFGNIQSYVFKTDKSIGFWDRRTWMSPAEYLEYQNRVASSGTIKIGFPTAKIEETAPDVFEGRIIGVTEGETFKKGIFGGVRGRSYIWDTMEKEVGESSAGISSKDFSYNIITKNEPYYGRTIKDILKEESKINELEHPVFNLGEKNQWFYKTQEMWKGGYGNKSFFINTFIDEATGEFKTGVIAKGEVVTGFGSGRTQIFERFSEGPVFGYRYGYKPSMFSKQTISGFIKDIRASTSISKLDQMSTSLSFGKISGRSSSGLAFSYLTVPTKSMVSGIGIASIYGVSKIRSDLKNYNQPSIKISNRELQNVYFNIPKYEKESVGTTLIDFKIPSQETGSLSKTLQFQIPEYDSRLSYKYVQQQIPVQDYKQLYITLPKLEGKTVYQKIPKWDTPYKTTVKFPIIPWSIPGGDGVGAGGGWSKYLSKGYRFRKWKVPKLEDFLGGW